MSHESRPSHTHTESRELTDHLHMSPDFTPTQKSHNLALVHALRSFSKNPHSNPTQWRRNRAKTRTCAGVTPWNRTKKSLGMDGFSSICFLEINLSITILFSHTTNPQAPQSLKSLGESEYSCHSFSPGGIELLHSTLPSSCTRTRAAHLQHTHKTHFGGQAQPHTLSDPTARQFSIHLLLDPRARPGGEDPQDTHGGDERLPRLRRAAA